MNCSFFCFLSYWFVSHNLLLRICILELISSFYHTCVLTKCSDDRFKIERNFFFLMESIELAKAIKDFLQPCCMMVYYSVGGAALQTAGFLCKYGKLLGSSALRLPFSCVIAITGPVYCPPLAAAAIYFFASRSSITLSELFEWMPRSLALSRSTSAAIFEAIRSSAEGLTFEEATEPFHSGRSAASFCLASLTREA